MVLAKATIATTATMGNNNNIVVVTVVANLYVCVCVRGMIYD